MPLAIPESLRPLLAGPVAIFGGGVSGGGACALLAAVGAQGVIYDDKTQPFTAKTAKLHRLVIFSPGFAPEHPWLALARGAACECLPEIEFAARFWRGRIVAVTGTNGKTTLTEFLTHALRSVGRDAHATGNIGHSFTQLVAATDGGAPQTVAVCEVSSFQAETLKDFRADATLWTNFAEDHLERHAGLEAYFSAKWNLVAHTTPGAVFAGSSVRRFAQRFDRPLPEAAAIATEGQPADAALADTVFAEYPQRENFLIAAAWWRAAGLAPEALYAAARGFHLAKHRLGRVAERNRAVYWNDSKATNFHAVEAALARFETPVILIAGGRGKGGDLAGFVHRIAPRVKHVLLIGETAAELAFHCATFRVAHSLCSSLAEAVRRAAELAVPGDNILLSPGFASFDLFTSYADRGDQFERLVQELPAAASF